MSKKMIAAVAFAVWTNGVYPVHAQQPPSPECHAGIKGPGVGVTTTSTPFKVVSCFSSPSSFSDAYIDLVLPQETSSPAPPVLASVKVIDQVLHHPEHPDHPYLGMYSFTGGPTDTTSTPHQGTRRLRLKLSDMYPNAPRLKSTDLHFVVILTAIDGRAATLELTIKITAP